MKTIVEVQRANTVGTDTHEVEGEPNGLSDLVNDALRTNNKFVTFKVPGGKTISVIADRVEAFWQE